MALNPNKLAFSRQTMYIPVTQFSCFAPGFTVTKAAILASGELGVSADSASATINNNTIAATLTLPNIVTNRSAEGTFATAAELGEISTSGIVGCKMNTAGMKVRHLMPIPNFWDRRHPIYVRPAWTSLSTDTADTIDWTFAYRGLVRGTNAITITEVGLDTVIAQDTIDATAVTVQETASGIIAGGSFNMTTQSWMKFSIELTAFAAGLTEDKYLIGVSFDYTPLFGRNIQDQSDPRVFGQTGASLTHGD